MGKGFVKILLNESTDKRGKIHKYIFLLTISVKLLSGLKNNAENNSTAWYTVHPSKCALRLACNETTAFH